MPGVVLAISVFIPVYFRAPLGGLQQHVRRITRALHRAGHRAVVMCPPGPFSEQLIQEGVHVLTTDFEEVSRDVDRALDAGPFHLVHAQPFKSRPVGLSLSRLAQIPCMQTFHRIYLDDLERCKDDLSLVIAVCPAIRDDLVARAKIDPAKVTVLPNGTDIERFASNGARRAPTGIATALFVGRLDSDKQLAIDAMVDAWEHQSRGTGPAVRWQIAGEGDLRERLEDKAQALGIAAEFCGWVDQDRLADLYRGADVAMGPGRCALDAMTAGTPTIGVGLKGYLGIIHGEATVRAYHGNFGESADEPTPYESGRLSQDLSWLFASPDRWERVSNDSASWAAATMDQRAFDAALLALYEQFARHDRPQLVLAEPAPVDAWRYWGESGTLAPHYQCPRSECLSRPEEAPDALQITSEDDQTFYVSTAGGGFEHPATDTGPWSLAADTVHRVQLDVQHHSGTPTVDLWIIEYDANQRLSHTRRALRAGTEEITWRTSKAMRSVRLAIRFVGPGHTTLGPVRLSRSAP